MPLRCETLAAVLSQGRGKGNCRALRGMCEELVKKERGGLQYMLAQTCEGLKIPTALHWFQGGALEAQLGVIPRLEYPAVSPTQRAARGSAWCWTTLGPAPREGHSPAALGVRLIPPVRAGSLS